MNFLFSPQKTKMKFISFFLLTCLMSVSQGFAMEYLREREENERKERQHRLERAETSYQTTIKSLEEELQGPRFEARTPEEQEQYKARIEKYKRRETKKLAKYYYNEGDRLSDKYYGFNCTMSRSHGEEKFFELWQRAADLGLPEAQCTVGDMYRSISPPFGISQDKAESKRLYKLAAAQKNAQGFYKLGCLYSEAPQKLTKAIRLLELAANQDHVGAKCKLAFLYLNNTACQDIGKAAALYKSLHENGHPYQGTLSSLFKVNITGNDAAD